MDREEIINAIEKAKKQSEEYAQDRIVVPFKEADMILALLKEQEAIESINFGNRTDIMANLEGLTWDDWRMYHSDTEVQNIAKSAFDLLITLLKEKKPKAIKYHDNPFTGLPVAHCPNCEKYASQFYTSVVEETHYCPWCGQEVTWNA